MAAAPPLLLELVILVVDRLQLAAGSSSFSAVSYAPCSATDPLQKFGVHDPHGTGRITDGSGRCLAIKNCDLKVTAGTPGTFPTIKIGNVGLDACGNGCSSGPFIKTRHTDPSRTQLTLRLISVSLWQTGRQFQQQVKRLCSRARRTQHSATR